MSVWNLVEFSSTTNLPLLYYVAILYAFGINIFRVEPADAIFSLWDGTPRTPLLRRKTFLIWKTAPSMTHKSSFNKFFFKLVESFFFLFQIPNSNTLFALLPASSNCWDLKFAQALKSIQSAKSKMDLHAWPKSTPSSSAKDSLARIMC